MWPKYNVKNSKNSWKMRKKRELIGMYTKWIHKISESSMLGKWHKSLGKMSGNKRANLTRSIFLRVNVSKAWLEDIDGWNSWKKNRSMYELSHAEPISKA